MLGDFENSVGEAGEAHEAKGQNPSEYEGDSGAFDEVWRLGEFEFFSESSHQDKREGEARTGTQRVDDRLQEPVPLVGLEEGESEDGAVRGD